MKNKIMFILPVFIIGLVLCSRSFAQSTTTKATTNTITVIKKECIMTAKTTFTNSVKSAEDIAKQAKMDAKNTRDTYINTAKANNDKIAIDTAIKLANSIYKKAIKDIMTTQKASLKIAKNDRVNSLKACSVK